MCDKNNPKKTLRDVYRFGLAALTLQFEGGISATELKPVKPFKYDPNADISGIKPRDATDEWLGVGIQIIGGIGGPAKQDGGKPKAEPQKD